MTTLEAAAEYGQLTRRGAERLLEEHGLMFAEAFEDLGDSVLDDGPIVAMTEVAKRQDALGRWHEFYESHEQHNQNFGYPAGHPKAKS